MVELRCNEYRAEWLLEARLEVAKLVLEYEQIVKQVGNGRKELEGEMGKMEEEMKEGIKKAVLEGVRRARPAVPGKA